jgi:hypothetical protein
MINEHYVCEGVMLIVTFSTDARRCHQGFYYLCG